MTRPTNFWRGVAEDVAGIAVGAVDIATAGTISGTKARVESFISSEGSIAERAQIANLAAARAQLNVVSLGFSGAEDKGEHLQELVGINAVQRSGTKYGEAWAEGDWERGVPSARPQH